jgi:hypothetical protein
MFSNDFLNSLLHNVFLMDIYIYKKGGGNENCKFDSPDIFIGFYIEHYKNCCVLDLNC